MRGNPERLYGAAARRLCLEVAQEIVAVIEASPMTPERTGRMERGYRAVPTPDGAAVVNPDAFYWRFQEFGTQDMPANPHVRPAIEQVRARRLGL